MVHNAQYLFKILLLVSGPSQKWDVLTTHVSSEMNSELSYNLPSLVSQQSSTKEAVRCIVWVCDLSKSWASVSQIEILSPQFTVTVEGPKKVDGLESDMLPQVLALSYKNFSSEVQHWIFQKCLVSSYYDTLRQKTFSFSILPPSSSPHFFKDFPIHF